jgi:elongation factor Ts
MATELANLALNYDSKEAFLAAEYKITVAEKLIEQTGYRRKIRNQNF